MAAAAPAVTAIANVRRGASSEQRARRGCRPHRPRHRADQLQVCANRWSSRCHGVRAWSEGNSSRSTDTSRSLSAARPWNASILAANGFGGHAPVEIRHAGLQPRPSTPPCRDIVLDDLIVMWIETVQSRVCWMSASSSMSHSRTPSASELSQLPARQSQRRCRRGAG